MVETNRPKPPLDVAIAAADTTSTLRLQPQQNQQQQQRPQQLPPQQLAHRASKTVHFETDFVASAADVTTNRASVTSLPDQFDKYVQQMFTFFGSALSVRHGYNDNNDNRHFCSDDNDDDNDSEDFKSDSISDDGAYYYRRGGFYGDGGFDGDDDEDKRSVSDNETARRKSSHHHHCKTSAATPFSYGARTISFERDVGKGNSPFRHMHCKTTAGTCNKVFLEKVTVTMVNNMCVCVSQISTIKSIKFQIIL